MTRRPIIPIPEQESVLVEPEPRRNKFLDTMDVYGTLAAYGLMFVSYPIVMPCVKAYYWAKKTWKGE